MLVLMTLCLLLGILCINYIDAKKSLQITTTAIQRYDLREQAVLAQKDHNNVTLIYNHDDSLKNGSSFEIVEEHMIGVSTQDQMGMYFDQIFCLKLDLLGNIYVADRTSMTIRKLDREGNFLLEIGPRGLNSGTFAQLIQFDISKDGNIWVWDSGNQCISRFSQIGDKIESFDIKLPQFPRSLRVADSKETLFFSYYDPENVNGEVIHKFDHIGNHIDSFGRPVTLELPNHHILTAISKNNYPGSLYLKSGLIYFSQLNPYNITIYSSEGKLLKQIFRENDFMEPPNYKILGVNKYLLPYPIVSSFIGVRLNDIINTIYFPDNKGGKPRTVFDVYGLDGNLRGSVDLLEQVYCFDIDETGCIYCVKKVMEGGDLIFRFAVKEL